MVGTLKIYTGEINDKLMTGLQHQIKGSTRMESGLY